MRRHRSELIIEDIQSFSYSVKETRLLLNEIVGGGFITIKHLFMELHLKELEKNPKVQIASELSITYPRMTGGTLKSGNE